MDENTTEIEAQKIEIDSQKLIKENKHKILKLAYGLTGPNHQNEFSLSDLEILADLPVNHSTHHFISTLIKEYGFTKRDTHKVKNGKWTDFRSYWAYTR